MEMCYDGAMVLPSSCAVMNEKEMCYVEGGKTYKISLTAKQCGDFAAAAAGGAAAAQILNFIPTVGNVLATSIGAVAGIYSSYFWTASNHRGMSLKIVCAGKVCLAVIPKIKW